MPPKWLILLQIVCLLVATVQGRWFSSGRFFGRSSRGSSTNYAPSAPKPNNEISPPKPGWNVVSNQNKNQFPAGHNANGFAPARSDSFASIKSNKNTNHHANGFAPTSSGSSSQPKKIVNPANSVAPIRRSHSDGYLLTNKKTNSANGFAPPGFQQPQVQLQYKASRLERGMTYLGYVNTVLQLPNNAFALYHNSREAFGKKTSDQQQANATVGTAQPQVPAQSQVPAQPEDQAKPQDPLRTYLEWNNSCFDASFRIQQKPSSVHALALNDLCKQDHQSWWAFQKKQVRLQTLPYCMTCQDGEENCRITIEKCDPDAEAQKFSLQFYSESNSTNPKFFSIKSDLFRDQCITMIRGKVTVNGCFYEPDQCPNYKPYSTNENVAAVPVRGSSIEECPSRLDFYYCYRQIFKLKDCIESKEQIFTYQLG